jgi:CheY-like chemotaxis protein
MSQRVLVVDDSATVRRVVGRTLTQAGYDVTLACDGRDALDKVQSQNPDLVLVDFVMPNMNGLKFVQAMRRIENLRTVPVVLMSAKADKIGDGFLAQTGAIDAITKPFSPEALLTVTEHALSRHAQILLGRDTEPPPAPSVERISSIPPSSDAPTDTSSDALARAADDIRARLGSTDGKLAALDPPALFGLVRELFALVPGQDGEQALEGRIEHVGLGEVLQLLTHQRQSGVVEVRKEPSQSRRSVSVCLKEGRVQLALGNVEESEFRLGRYLLREGLIEPAELERIGRNRGERSLLGTHLVKLGIISSDELNRVLVQQTSELIYEALRWKRGRYRFVRFASRPEANDARLSLPLPSLLMEGLRRVDEWRLIEEQVRSFDEVPRRDDEALSHVDASRLRPEERTILQAIDGERTVREIVEYTRMASFDACKILFQLSTSRLVRVSRPSN